MKYTLPKGYLSASALSKLLQCPKQFEFRYIYNMHSPGNAALAVGGVAHKTLEVYYVDAMSSRIRLSGEQAAELAMVQWADYLDENEISLGKEEIESARKNLRELIQCYVVHVAKDVIPKAVEEKILFTTAAGIDLLGYIDLRYAKPVSDEDRKSAETEGLALDDEGLVDYKVTSKKWSSAQLKNSLQFNLYALMTGVGEIQVHNLIKDASVKTLPKKSSEDGIVDYTANLRVLRHRFNGGQAAHMENLVEAAARLITSGIFIPCDPGAWCCSKDWCSYWNVCRGV